MRFRRFVAGVTFLAVAAMAAQVTVDSDTFWHLAAGRWIWENGQLLRVDPFSITRMGHAWVYPGWLAQLFLYASYKTLNFFGLNLITLIAVIFTFGMLWMKMAEPPLIRGFVVITATATSAIFWSARPQILSLMLTAVFLFVLEGEQKTGPSWKLWLLPPLMALWANLHGGFITGFLLIFAYIGGQLVEFGLATLLGSQKLAAAWNDYRLSTLRFTMLIGFCLLAVAINPFGIQMLLYPFKTISLEILSSYVQEWQSPDFHLPNTWPFAFMILATAISLGLSRRKKRAYEFLLFLGLGGLALHSARNIALFAAGLAFTFSRHLESAVRPIAERIGSGRQVPETLANRLNLIAFSLLSIAILIWGYPRMSASATQQMIERQFPVEAVDFLQGQAEPVLFHTYRWGGYLIWRDWPNIKSFVDGRTDLFGDQLLSEYLAIYRAEPGFQELLEKRSVEWLLLDSSSPLATAADRAGWPILKQSPVSILYHIE